MILYSLCSLGRSALRAYNLPNNGTKKTWNSTVVVPRSEAFALPNIQEQTTRSPRRYKL